MTEQSGSYQQDSAWSLFSSLPFDLDSSIFASSDPLPKSPSLPSNSEYGPKIPSPDSESNFNHFIDYEALLSLEFHTTEEEQGTTPYNPIDQTSPSASTSTSGPSTSPLNDDLLWFPSSYSTSTRFKTRITTKDDLQNNPRFRDAIQTVSEFRKARRRAQNRTAQQAFKERKKKREKELTIQIGAAEQTYKALLAQNEQLKEDLDRRRQEQLGSRGVSFGTNEDGVDKIQEKRGKS